VLASLKNEKLSSKEKKKETEAFLGPLAEERFALLVNLGKKITDFGHDPNAAKVWLFFYLFAILVNLGKKITDFGHNPNAAKVGYFFLSHCY
jgi:hypothetical protein